MIAKTFAALLALSSTVLAQNTAGIKASLDIAVVEQAKDVYMDLILKFVNNMQLPDMGDSKDYLHGNHVSVQQNAQDVVF